MKALKIVAVSDQNLKTNLASPNSSRFYSKSLSATTGNTVSKLQYQSKSTSSSIALSSLSSSSSPAVATHCLPLSQSQEELGTETTDICKSVHVKFLMNIECQFGDHILMVGDDPLLGLWSPLNALPCNWSEGHLWTLVLEMPVDKSFKYKFLLKKSSGEFLWQPGPDRVFTSRETENIIVVIEQWENVEAQKVSEEPIIDKNESGLNPTRGEEQEYRQADREEEG